MNSIINTSLENLLPSSENEVNEYEQSGLNDFLERLKTYIPALEISSNEVKWSLKPQSLSPYIFAKYGWVCVGKDLIQCINCKEIFSCQLPKPWKSEIYDECVKEVEKKIITAHKSICPWPTSPTPQKFYKMQIDSKKYVLKRFRDNFDSLLNINSKIPEIDEMAIFKLDLTHEQNVNLHKLCNSNGEFSRPLLFLAMTGWKMSDEFPKEKIYCPDCLRSVSLCFYIPRNTLINSSSIKIELNEEGEATNKKIRLIKELPSKSLDPFYEHRDWCKWVRPALVTGEKETIKQGWELFKDFLLKNINNLEENSKSLEYVGKVSKTLQTWLDSFEPN